MPTAWEEYTNLQIIDKRLLKIINLLIADTVRHPTEGLGKPERLKGELSEFWRRRISQEHRLVYRIEEDRIVIFQCTTHYKQI